MSRPSSRSVMVDPPFQPGPEGRRVALHRGEANVEVARLESSHRRLGSPHARRHLHLGYPQLVAQRGQVPAERLSALAHLPESGEDGKVTVLVHGAPIISYLR